MKNIILLLLISNLLWFGGYAQNNCNLKLTLQIKDDHTLEVLENTYILIKETNTQLVTNAKGEIVIGNLCKQKYTLKITHVGCQEQTISIDLKANTIKEIFLHHVKTELGEVVVTENRNATTTAKTNLKGLDVFQTRGLSLAQSLQKINGVRLLQTGSNITKPVINGLHSNRIAIVNNGIKLESQQWGLDHAPEINAANIYKFSVIKGANAIRYGAEAMAGIILAEPKPLPLLKKTEAEINTAFYSNNLMGLLSAAIEGSNGKATNFSWRIASSIKKGGNQRIPHFWVANTAFDEYNFNAAAQLKHNHLTILTTIDIFNTHIGLYPGAHVENLDDLNNAIKSTTPLFKSNFSYVIDRPKQTATHITGKIETNYQWNNKHKSTLTLSHQENKRDEYDPRSFITLPDMSLSLGTTTAEALHDINFSEHAQLQTGISYSFQQNVNNPISSRIFIRNYQTSNIAAFTGYKLVKNNWVVELGGRIDNKWFESYYRKNDTLTLHERWFTNFSTSVGVKRNFTKNFAVSLNIGNAFRPPAPNELYANGVHQGLASIEIGNQDFNTEKSFTTALNLEYKKDSAVAVEVYLYQNKFNNFIYLEPTLPPALTIRGYYPVFNYKQANATFTGIDASVMFNTKNNFSTTLKASVLYAKNTSTNDWLILMPADRFEINFKKQFKLKKLIKPYTQIGVVHVLEQKRIPQQIPDYAPPPKAYTLIDAEAGAIFSKSGITAGISLYNLLNTSYRDYLNRLRYFINETGFNAAFRIKIPINIK